MIKKRPVSQVTAGHVPLKNASQWTIESLAYDAMMAGAPPAGY